MRFVPISNAKPGMVLGRCLMNEERQVLLYEGMQLTEEYIERLGERGLQGFYIDDEISKDIIISDTISDALRNKAVECLLKNDIDATLNVAEKIVDELLAAKVISIDLMDLRTFDEYTFSHSVNVAILSTVVGIGMKLSRKSLIELCTAAILHDVGKLKIPTEILNKPSRLTRDEYAIMKTHSQLSYEYLKDKYQIAAVTKLAVLSHHENLDGTGYPNGMKGEEIHIYARIIHVADVYDALTTARPYKSAYSPLESIEYLMGGSGIMFDPEVVRAFMKFVPVYPKGISVLLSTGEEAIVVENHLDNMTRPKIRLMDGTDIDLAEDRRAMNTTIIRILDESYTSRKNRSKDKRKHILVVDDMMVNLKAAEGILGGLYRVSATKSAAQALAFLARKKPDLIVLDVDMPEMNGIDLAEKIRKEIDRKVPIIFVSSISNKEIIMKANRLNAKDYVLKPYRALYLLDRVNKALEEDKVIV